MFIYNVIHDAHRNKFIRIQNMEDHILSGHI